MLLLFGAFIAGIITVFAPCVLPLLPIIIGGSVTGSAMDKKRPVIIAASLAVSLIVFTLLLKATSLLINIPPQAITYTSGVIIVVVGLLSLFPDIYEKAIIKLGIQTRSQKLMGSGLKRKGLLGPIVTGAALGPVFSSCSPVYAYILATVLPASFTVAMGYIVAYVLGLSVMLLLIGFIGQRLITRLKWASNPKGVFQRIIAILFIVVGVMVFTGYDKKLQTYVSETTPFDFDGLSAQLIPGSRETSADILNVEPYEAPEFVRLEQWINSKPLKMSQLKGKVVLVDFWTYSCINCIRTQPYLKGWDDIYRDSGLVIIGMHAPEFAFEKVPANVEKAVREAGLKYPIALDNDFATWAAYENQYWPASYLVDTKGMVRRVHFGEGEYKQTEDAIRQLLREGGKQVPDTRYVKADTQLDVSREQTPETYLGTGRAAGYVGSQPLVSGTHTFTATESLGQNKWTLGGDWTVSDESIVAGNDAILRFNVSAKDIYLVTANGSNGAIELSVDRKPISKTQHAGADVRDSKVVVSGAKLYHILERESFAKNMVIELRVPKGMAINAFTFGS